MASETITDIVKSLRDGSIYDENGNFDSHEIADRIESAHKRESVTDCNGLNAVKVCEVVTKWRKHIEFKFANGFGIDSASHIGRDMLACLVEIKQSISAPLDTKSPENVNSEKVIYNGAKIREALVWVHNHLFDALYRGRDLDAVEAMRRIWDAFAVPPRNCDKFKNYGDALEVFEKQIRSEGRLGFINPFIEVVKWLFAEAKGEVK